MHSEDDLTYIIDMDYCDAGETEQNDAPSLKCDDMKKFSDIVRSERINCWPRPSKDAAMMSELHVYNGCLSAGTNNVLGPRQLIQTTNNMQAWRALSTGHPDDEWVTDCIEFGFPMQYRGPPLHNNVTSNHPSAICHQEHVDKYIESEAAMGALIGPFQAPPFDGWCNVAPLMTREKANKVDRRIIVDLSFPPGNGPNFHIVKNMVFGKVLPHVLPSVNDAINIITALDFNVMLASVDISRAYRNFALDPLDWPLACIQHRERFYIDRCMPFGSRISSLYMQKVACMLQRALLSRGIKTVAYLDDLLIISPRSSDPDAQFHTTIDVIRSVGLPVAWDKVATPTRCIRFLGIIIDLDRREIRIPQDKIQKFLDLLNVVMGRKYISKRTMQQLIGHINHISKGVPSARFFMNRLLECLRGSNNTIRVDERITSDLRWFLEFLTQFNGRSVINGPEPDLIIEADSCLIGGGGRMQDKCYAFKYPSEIAESMHITQLEAYNCVIAARVFLWDCQNICVKIICDNKGAVSSLSSGRARDPILCTIGRAFWFLSAKRNIKFRFEHMPGDSMCVADALSRKFISRQDELKASKIVESLRLHYLPVEEYHCDYRSYL